MCCAFKPQIAHFAALGAEDALQRLIAHIHAAHPGIPVILDSKRGDIGSTAQHYATEAFDRFAADAVTANPYLGRDSVQPFLDRADRGVVILCRTSNPGAGDLQDLVVDGRPLYQHVAEKVARDWNGHGNCALVVGATWPAQLKEVRAIVGDVPFLVPGVGAQGGDVEAVVSNAKTADGTGLIVSSSRADAVRFGRRRLCAGRRRRSDAACATRSIATADTLHPPEASAAGLRSATAHGCTGQHLFLPSS